MVKDKRESSALWEMQFAVAQRPKSRKVDRRAAEMQFQHCWALIPGLLSED